MTFAPGRKPVASMLWAAVIAALVSSVLWWVWAQPITVSVRDATVLSTGTDESIVVEAGTDVVGVWASGRAAAFGTLACFVDDEPAAGWPGPSLSWDDTLWWASGRHGFEQDQQLTLDPTASHEVRCEDGFDGTYEAEYVVARDSFGSGMLGLGRTGAADFPVGSIMAVLTVAGPLLAIMFPFVALANAVSNRRAARSVGASFGA